LKAHLDRSASIRNMQHGPSQLRALLPKTRTSLAWLTGILAGLLVTGCVIHYATGGIGNSPARQRPPQRSAKALGVSGTQQRFRYGFMDLGVAFGWTRAQVRREIGPPTAKEANCWIYRGRGDTIRGRYSAGADGMKFCFSAGPTGGTVMMHVSGHYPAQTVTLLNRATGKLTKKHYAAAWGGVVTLRKVPDWYLQESS
jgi:hypothetical protein